MFTARFLFGLFVLSLFSISSSVAAPTGTTVYAFPPNANNFSVGPTGAIMDAQGNLFGVTKNGTTGSFGVACLNSAGCGSVYELTKSGGSWSETQLYQFTGGKDGCLPVGQLVFGPAGALYGATSNAFCTGYGTIFQLTPPGAPGGTWTFQTIYTFQGGPDGAYPNASLAVDKTGDIYGTNVWGVAFKLAPRAGNSWKFSNIAIFPGASGGLLSDAKGNLYGTIPAMGSSCTGNCGSVFELTKSSNGSWTPTTLTTFAGGNDGTAPNWDSQLGLAIDGSGDIFGVAEPPTVDPCSKPLKCGQVYELVHGSKGWTRTPLYRFSGTDGALPMALAATADGNAVYGYTFEGGSASEGTVYRLAAPATTGAWTLDSWNYANFPFSNVVFDPTGFGVYLTPQPSSVINVSFQADIALLGPYTKATSGPCIVVTTNNAAGLVTFTNSCTRTAWYWGCAEARTSSDARGFDYCNPNQGAAGYGSGYLLAGGAVSVSVASVGTGLYAFGESFECPKGKYPYYNSTGKPYLECAFAAQ